MLNVSTLAREGGRLAQLVLMYNSCLLERITRSMTVTDAGIILYERAKSLLDEVAMARAGLGIVRQPEWLVAEDLKAGSLLSLFDEHTAPLLRDAPAIYAILQQRRYRSAKADAFLQFAKTVINADKK